MTHLFKSFDEKVLTKPDLIHIQVPMKNSDNYDTMRLISATHVADTAVATSWQDNMLL